MPCCHFYFASDVVLLETLSQSSDLHVVQIHMEPLLEEIIGVVLEKMKVISKHPACLPVGGGVPVRICVFVCVFVVCGLCLCVSVGVLECVRMDRCVCMCVCVCVCVFALLVFVKTAYLL